MKNKRFMVERIGEKLCVYYWSEKESGWIHHKLWMKRLRKNIIKTLGLKK